MIKKEIQTVDGNTYTVLCTTEECKYTDIADIHAHMTAEDGIILTIFILLLFASGFVCGALKTLELERKQI